jgi:hypothetical protein
MASRVGGSAWAVAFAVFLLAPSAAAGSVLAVNADQVDVQGGTARAALASATIEKDACAGLTITGTVEHLHLEMDHSHADYAVLDKASSPLNPVSEPPLDADNAVVTISNPTAGCRIHAWLDAGMAATVAFPEGPTHLEPAPAVAGSYHSHTNSKRTWSAGGGPDLLAVGGGPGLTQLEGNLRLAIWEATLDVRAGNVSYHAILGEQQSPAQPLPGVGMPDVAKTFVVAVDVREAFTWFRGAHLSWTFPQGATVVTSSAHVEAPRGAAQLHNDVLPSSGTVPLLTVPAPRGDLHASGTRVLGSLEANAASAPGGQAVAAAGPRLPAWPLWAGAMLLLSAAGGRRLALEGMRRAIDADDCERAARLALAVWPATPESRVARVVCLLRLGRLDAAERALRPQRWRAQQATRSFLQARLEASRGEAAAARRHLAACFLLSPAFVADARADLALHGFVEGALGAGRGQDPREGYA